MTHTTLTQLAPGHLANLERFTILGDPAECWAWSGPHDRYGYAECVARFGGRRVRIGAHRVAYLVAHGSVPTGLVLDHLCRNRWCVNPTHLEPVTNRENTLRQRWSGMCRSGKHEMTDANSQWSKDGRHRRCRACIYASTRAWKERVA